MQERRERATVAHTHTHTILIMHHSTVSFDDSPNKVIATEKIRDVGGMMKDCMNKERGAADNIEVQRW